MDTRPPIFQIVVTLGERRLEFVLDSAVVGDGREAELEAKLASIAPAIRHLARGTGLRPKEDAFFETVMAFKRAADAGNVTEANRILASITSA